MQYIIRRLARFDGEVPSQIYMGFVIQKLLKYKRILVSFVQKPKPTFFFVPIFPKTDNPILHIFWWVPSNTSILLKCMSSVALITNYMLQKINKPVQLPQILPKPTESAKEYNKKQLNVCIHNIPSNLSKCKKDVEIEGANVKQCSLCNEILQCLHHGARMDKYVAQNQKLVIV